MLRPAQSILCDRPASGSGAGRHGLRHCLCHRLDRRRPVLTAWATIAWRPTPGPPPPGACSVGGTQVVASRQYVWLHLLCTPRLRPSGGIALVRVAGCRAVLQARAASPGTASVGEDRDMTPAPSLPDRPADRRVEAAAAPASEAGPCVARPAGNVGNSGGTSSVAGPCVARPALWEVGDPAARSGSTAEAGTPACTADRVAREDGLADAPARAGRETDDPPAQAAAASPS